MKEVLKEIENLLHKKNNGIEPFNTKCEACGVFFRGKRGLKIHYVKVHLWEEEMEAYEI